jgi:serine/threonine-protein kinase
VAGDAPPLEPPPGTRRYERLLQLGSDGTSVLWLAVALGSYDVCRLVVLKTLAQQRASDEKAVRQLVDEARVTARLNHPNIVQMLDLVRDGQAPVLVMEYLPGPCLATLVALANDSPAFTIELRLAIISRLLRGLDHAHRVRDFDGRSLRVVHGAVSPTNIVVTFDGQVKLIDFSCCSLGTDGSEHVPARRALPYLAPEQLSGTLDLRVDLFSVGVILWELIAGRPMWGSTPAPTVMRRLLAGEMPDLAEARPGVDAELARICSRALARHPDTRYRSASEMRSEIDRYLERRGSTHRDGAIASLVRRTCREQQRHTQRLIEARLARLGISVARAVQGSGGFWPGVRAALAGATRSAGGRAAAAVAVAALGLWLWSSSRPEPQLAQERGSLSPAGAPGVVRPDPAALAFQCPTAPEAPRLVRLELSVEPPGALLYLDGRRLSSNPIDARLVLDSRPHTLRAEAEGYAELVSTFQLESDLKLDAELRPLQPD